MNKRRGFTLIELTIVVGILGILSALLVVNSSTARLRSRDASRRESVSSYHTSFEQYAAARSSYFVKSGSCVQTGTANQSGRPVYIQASGTGCAGIYGGGSGRITRRNSPTNSLYATISIADALVKEGYLSRIYTDPLDAKLPYGSHSDRDFIVTLCQADGNPALSTDTAKEFAIYTSLEGTAPKEEGPAKQLCGGSSTNGGGWEYWLADASTVSPTRSFASVSAVGAVAAGNNQAAPVALNLPKTTITDVQAAYATTEHVVKGTFTVRNPDPAAVGTVYFTASLVGGATTSQQQLGDVNATNLVTLAPNETRTVSYALPVDDRLNTGTYFIVARGWTQTGLPFAIASKPVDISGTSNVFLDFDSSKGALYRDGAVIPPLAAATYTTSQKVTAAFVVRNDHALNFVVTPRVQIFDRAALPGTSPIKTEKYAGITVNAKSDQFYQVVLPTMTNPESYLARIDLLDANGKPLSGYQEYRWVLAGEGGKVLTATIDGTQLLTHTVLNASTTVVGPADGSEIAEAHLAIKIIDSTSKDVLFSDQQTIPQLNSTPRNLTFPVDFKSGLRSLQNITVQFVLTGTGGGTLDDSAATYNLNLARSNPPYYLVVPIILLLIGMVVLIRRSHKSTMHYMKPTALVVATLLMFGTFMSPLHVQAQVVSSAVQTTDLAGCNAVPIQSGVPAQCTTIWTNHQYPQVQVIRNYDKTVLAVNDSVTVSVQFSLDPANNGTLAADLTATHAVADPDPDCVDAINYADTNVVTGLWVKSVTAVSAGTTQIAVNVHTDPATQCWQANSCVVDNAVQQVITCSPSGGGATPTPAGTPFPTPSFTPSASHFIGSGSKLF
jgi:prepilin-type N-terminal cleavage/methylation domain-containing protein